MDSEHPLLYRPNYNTYSLRIGSKHIISDLKSFGLHQNKSLTLKWISSCPEQFISHLVRGYFDGDGHISIAKGKSLVCEILGTKHFLSAISQLRGFPNPTLKQGSRVFRIRLGGQQAFDFCKWIYDEKNSLFCLPRKKELYQRAYREAPPKSPKTSAFVGVTKQKNRSKWHSCIRVDGATVHLGDFELETEAAMAYNEYVICHSLKRKLNKILL